MNSPQITSKWERLPVRLDGERRAQRALVQLVCTVSILRTALTDVLPMAGGAAWWVVLAGLMPGLAVYALLAVLMHQTASPGLLPLTGLCLGRRTCRAVSVLGGLMMLGEAAASLTALVTVFTEGVGTSGTRWTLTLLTCGALAVSLHGEGLPRAAVLLRRVLAAGAVAAAALSLRRLRWDGLFPMTPEGPHAAWAAVLRSCSLGWPLVYLLAVPDESPRRRVSAPCPVILTVLAAVVILHLLMPHEVLAGSRSAADCLLLPDRGAPSSLRMLLRCLLMLGFFLGIAGSVLLAAEGVKSAVRWPKIPWVLLAAAALTQTPYAADLRRWLTLAQPWLLVPPTILALLTGGMALRRRCVK